jgi:hypothetical protein
MKQVVAALLLAAPFLQAAASERISRYYGVFTSPPCGVPSQETVDGPLLGNGDVGVVLSGTPEAQRFWISKSDCWKPKPGTTTPCPIGGIEVLIPAVEGAAYHAEHRMEDAQVRSSFRRAIPRCTCVPGAPPWRTCSSSS